VLSSRRSRLVAAAAVIVVVAVGVGVWWVFFRDDAPPAADIDTASETLDGCPGGGDGDLNGPWSVNTDTGSDEDDTSTFAGYRIGEELAGIGSTTAVGRTHDVSGSLTVDGDQVTEASFEVDMTTLESDRPQRDNTLKTRGLETENFQTATFTLTEPFDIPDDARSAGEATLSAVGELDLHGVTQEVTLDIDACLDGETVGLVGSVPIALADYQIEPPTIPGRVLGVEDQGELEFQIFMTKG
jgi:polyisoprenoid-binding protein YceI